MRHQAGYVTLLCVLFTLSTFANHVDEYISNYKDIAQREMKRSKIPASIILAQGIHESSWGRGALALNSKNHFGIKCKDYWTGPTFYAEDDDYENGKLIKSCFRAYENVESSYIDHTDFLLNSDRYQGLFLYDPTDYKSWAKGLKQCGYATDPRYAEKLIRIIETHQLYLFDLLDVDVFVMEAPTFFIPPQFLNHQSTNTIEDSSTEEVFTYHEEQIEEASMFNYQVPIDQLPPSEERIEEEVAVYPEPEALEFNTTNAYTYHLTEVIPNSSARDKKVQNLSRKPRMSSVAGPR